MELTLALHYVFNTPEDRLVWDVGHQTYPHKILTGRRERMHTLRQKDGLAGFPRRDESEYDTFGTGHSSTSVSAALGMAVAAARTAAARKVVAVIGDGALSAGMAFEALNNAGDTHADILVILNDNDMSISHNVGAMSNYLARILSGKVFTSVREGSKTVLSTVPPMWEFAKRWEEHVKGMVMPSTLFEEMGFQYFGPIDGHDLPTLVRTLRNLRRHKGPRFLHVVTRKGKGYEAGRGRPVHLPRRHAVRSGHRQDGKEARGQDLHPGLRRVAVRHGRARRAPRRHHARHARGFGAWSNSRSASRTAISTSASPSSTRSPSPPGSPATA